MRYYKRNHNTNICISMYVYKRHKQKASTIQKKTQKVRSRIRSKEVVREEETSHQTNHMLTQIIIVIISFRINPAQAIN